MLKKTCSVLLLIAILVAAVGTVYAIEQFPDALRGWGGFSVNASVTTKSGKIYANGEITNVPDGYTVKVKPVLQKKTSTGWTTVKTKTSGSGQSVCAYADYAKGTYRAKVTCTLTKTDNTDTQTTKPLYSKEKTFN